MSLMLAQAATMVDRALANAEQLGTKPMAVIGLVADRTRLFWIDLACSKAGIAAEFSEGSEA